MTENACIDVSSRQPDRRLQLTFAVALGALMLPPLSFALSFGNEAVYRGAQILWIGLLVAAAAQAPRRLQDRPSYTALLIVSVLLISLVEATIRQAISDGVIFGGPIVKTIILSAIFLLLDRFRNVTFERFARLSLPLVFVILTVTTIHLAVNPTIVWGRYLFFGLHPNLGGEILFTCLLLMTFSRSVWVRLGGSLFAVVLIALLQARAALLGSGFALLLSEAAFAYTAYRTHHLTLSTILGGVFFFCVTASVVLFPNALLSLLSVIDDRVLFLNDRYRGFDTGIVGRIETWGYALDVFLRNPIFGSGLDQSGRAASGNVIHNGYLLLFAEFGMLSLTFHFVLIAGLIQSARQRSPRFVIILASMVVFFFNARSLNLNVYPMIMWIACLPWTPAVTNRDGSG